MGKDKGKGKQVVQQPELSANILDDEHDSGIYDAQEALYQPLYPHAGILPTHQAEEILLKRLHLEPGVRLKWRIDRENQGHAVFAISEVDDFLKLKRVLADQLVELGPGSSNYYVDKFVLLFVNCKNELVGSGIKASEKKYRKTGTEMSPSTFNIFIKAFKTRISPFDQYCVCGDKGSICEGATNCPNIEVDLAVLNDDYERVVKKEKGKGKNKSKRRATTNDKLDPDRILRVALEASNASYAVTTQNVDPQLIIPATCLRRLMSRNEIRGHNALATTIENVPPGRDDSNPTYEEPEQPHIRIQQGVTGEGDIAMKPFGSIQDHTSTERLLKQCSGAHGTSVGYDSTIDKTRDSKLSVILRRNFRNPNSSIHSSSNGADLDVPTGRRNDQEIINISDGDDDDGNTKKDNGRISRTQTRSKDNSDNASTTSLDSVEQIQKRLRNPNKIRRR